MSKVVVTDSRRQLGLERHDPVVAADGEEVDFMFARRCPKVGDRRLGGIQ